MGATQSIGLSPELQELQEQYQKVLGEGNAATILYRYNPDKKEWELRHKSVVASFYDANEDRPGDREWHLEIPQVDVDIPLTSEFQHTGTNSTNSVVFIDPTSAAVYQLLYGGVGSAERYSAFLQDLNRRLFENTYQKEATEKNTKAALGEYADYMMTDQYPDYSNADWETADPEPVPTGAEEKRAAQLSGDAIHGVTMGAGNRSYLLRGQNIRVLNNVQGGVDDAGIDINMEPVRGQIRSQQQGSGPAHLLLHNQERQLTMLRPEAAGKLLAMDLESEQAVAEWQFQKDGVDVEMTDVASDSKGAQLGPSSTFLGLDANRVCRWDMRTQQGVVQDVSPVLDYAGGKDYSRGTNFQCLATTGDGCVAIGSRDGKVRLYSPTSLQRAVTAVSSLGAPITAIDVTYDGHYVLATTDRYLMVIPTKTSNSRTGAASTGFRHNMGKDKLPPKLLRLHLSDVELTKNQPLRHGRFTWITEADRQERWICASVGTYTVMFNFRTVKIAKPTTTSVGNLLTISDPSMYYLVEKKEDVVDSQFVHDNFAAGGRTRDSVLVVTSHNVWTVAPKE